MWVIKGAKNIIGDLNRIPSTTVSTHGDRIYLQASENDNSTAAQIAEGLRKLGLAFSAGKDWSPEAYVGFLKDNGLVAGQFDVIYWTKPGQWTLGIIE
jgi:hypothetical protein